MTTQSGFGDDDFDAEPDGRALADRLPRTDPNGLVSSQRYSRPWSATNGRAVPGKIDDAEAAAPLADLFAIAAQDGDLYRRDLDSLNWADDVSSYKRDQLRGQIRTRYAEIRRMRAEGRLADARAAARAATAEFAGFLDAPRREEYEGYDGRQLADMVPRTGAPARDLPPRG